MFFISKRKEAFNKNNDKQKTEKEHVYCIHLLRRASNSICSVALTPSVNTQKIDQLEANNIQMNFFVLDTLKTCQVKTSIK